MFATATPFLPQYSACMNNTSSNFFAFQNDKENYNPFTQNKSQHQRQFSRQEARPFTSQPLSQINPFAQVQLATQQECSAMFGGNFAKKTQVSDNNCLHQSTKKYKRTFCKDCGIFIPSSGAEAYTEQVFKTKMDSHPDEVIAIMLKNQHKNREYLQNSTHIKYRQPLVEWISNIGEELHFFCDTIYTAISYLDTILLKVEIPKNKLQLLCICSLIAAAKFCEKEEKVPSYREVFERCQGIYSIDLLKKTESFVLESLEWNLKTVTPFQFIEFYLSKGCTFASDRSLIRKIDPKLLRYLRKYAEFFVDSAVQNYDFNSYDSNIIACASICAARKAVGLMPLWTAELEELTEVSWEQIEVCFTLLYSSFEVAYPDIAQKANSFIEQAQRQANNEVAELEKSYAAMTIENRNGTPSFKGSSWRESPKSDESEPKMERPETADEERRSCRMEWTMVEQARDAFNQEKLRMLEMKMKENRMNIENAGQGFSGAAGKIKRNLIF